MGAALGLSNFEQIAPDDGHRLPPARVDVGHKASRLVSWESVMSKTDELRQHADEAMCRALNCKNPKEKLLLINMACMWMQAAERRASPVVVKELPPELRVV